MRDILHKHKLYWTEKKFRQSAILSVLFLAFTFVVNHYTSLYANWAASNSVNDIILDNFKVRNVNGILIYGIIIYAAIVIWLLIKEPKRFSFTIKSLSLFYLIRALFTTFTHLATHPEHIPVDPANFLSYLIAGDTLFFSGHTGMPFLVALIFWDDKLIRNFSLATSIIMAISVLLGHVHYTIDVAAAFFITYTIYCISLKLFSKDHQVMRGE